MDYYFIAVGPEETLALFYLYTRSSKVVIIFTDRDAIPPILPYVRQSIGADTPVWIMSDHADSIAAAQAHIEDLYPDVLADIVFLEDTDTRAVAMLAQIASR